MHAVLLHLFEAYLYSQHDWNQQGPAHNVFGGCCRDIVNNKIAAGEVGDDLRKVASTLTDTVTQTERTVEKKVSNLSTDRLLYLDAHA